MGILSALSMNCGTVISGRFLDCKLSPGTSSKKFINTEPPDQLLFIKGFKEVARMDIAAEVESYVLDEKLSGAMLEIKWKNGETSKIDMPLLEPNNGADPRRGIKLIQSALARKLG